MAFPEKIQVKISSEAAGSVSFSPVVVQQMGRAELLAHILHVTGKDEARITEILRRGAVVSGASRLRWPSVEVLAEELAEVLRVFPDAQPDRVFDPARCVRAALIGGRATIDLAREAASRKGWLQKRSFWQALLKETANLALTYQCYSYGDRADVYRAELPVESALALRDQASLLRFSTLEQMVREYAYDALELWVER